MVVLFFSDKWQNNVAKLRLLPSFELCLMHFTHYLLLLPVHIAVQYVLYVFLPLFFPSSPDSSSLLLCCIILMNRTGDSAFCLQS